MEVEFPAPGGHWEEMENCMENCPICGTALDVERKPDGSLLSACDTCLGYIKRSNAADNTTDITIGNFAVHLEAGFHDETDALIQRCVHLIAGEYAQAIRK